MVLLSKSKVPTQVWKNASLLTRNTNGKCLYPNSNIWLFKCKIGRYITHLTTLFATLALGHGGPSKISSLAILWIPNARISLFHAVPQTLVPAIPVPFICPHPCPCPPSFSSILEHNCLEAPTWLWCRLWTSTHVFILKGSDEVYKLPQTISIYFWLNAVVSLGKLQIGVSIKQSVKK